MIFVLVEKTDFREGQVESRVKMGKKLSFLQVQSVAIFPILFWKDRSLFLHVFACS